MSTVWYAIPSARPPTEAGKCLRKWKEMGYKIALFRDIGAPRIITDFCIHAEYPGYARAVNALAAAILRVDPDCEWIVTGGDDVFPEMHKPPAEIAAECGEHFGGTLGVMQPTGDRHMVDREGKCAAERACISPWLGRAWCERAYGGRGPLWPDYRWEFVDEDLHEVALKLGLLWHRPDLTHYHEWWGRGGGEVPEHIQRNQHWSAEGRTIFEARKAAGFPGSELR
jgi:hypothetical protein